PKLESAVVTFEHRARADNGASELRKKNCPSRCKDMRLRISENRGVIFFEPEVLLNPLTVQVLEGRCVAGIPADYFDFPVVGGPMEGGNDALGERSRT